MDQLIDADAHGALLAKLRSGASDFRARGDEPAEQLDLTDDSVRSAARTDARFPRLPSGASRRSRSISRRSTAT